MLEYTSNRYTSFYSQQADRVLLILDYNSGLEPKIFENSFYKMSRAVSRQRPDVWRMSNYWIGWKQKHFKIFNIQAVIINLLKWPSKNWTKNVEFSLKYTNWELRKKKKNLKSLETTCWFQSPSRKGIEKNSSNFWRGLIKCRLP